MGKNFSISNFVPPGVRLSLFIVGNFLTMCALEKTPEYQDFCALSPLLESNFGAYEPAVADFVGF